LYAVVLIAALVLSAAAVATFAAMDGPNFIKSSTIHHDDRMINMITPVCIIVGIFA
jgi:hypothetical protein